MKTVIEAIEIHMICRHPDEVLCVLWLGSSAGNMTPEDSLAFFKEILQISGPDTEVSPCKLLYVPSDVTSKDFEQADRLPHLLNWFFHSLKPSQVDSYVSLHGRCSLFSR